MRAPGLIAAFGYAVRGIAYAWRTQRNVRIQTAIAVVVILAGLWLGVNALGWALLVVAITVVLAAELLNTALEAIVDLVSPQSNPLAGAAKDACAAAVVMTVICAVIIGVLVLGPALLEKVQLALST